ncbi:MAG: D-alanine--D-alanine ligase A [Chloroflexi bacterium HGW-Chloroflexi-1]|nr:MAG: D-alanine--D-alanine ligase A [Chloroflexi bacterium HGW-Chloroflexi-1]
MQRKIRVGVIFGGRSGEHEVSLASARSIMAAIDREAYDVVPLGITHAGQWLTSGDPMAVLSAGRSATLDTGLAATHPATTGRELVPGATGEAFPPLDVIFPVLHGPYGEDGTVQGLFELAGVPYVGCGVLASALAMDKIASKELFAAHGLPVTAGRAVKRKAWEAEPEAVLNGLEAALGYPMFVKPANLGSSIGISKARDRDGLRAALDEAARYDRKLLVEEAVPNAREIECSVLGNDDPIASAPGEIVASNEFYDYAAKYIDGKSQLLIPAPISADIAAQVQELAVRAFRAIDGAGLARVDFLLNGVTGELYLSEINSLPGFTEISMYPKLWEASGLPYRELIDRLIELALERHTDCGRSLTAYNGAMPAG